MQEGKGTLGLVYDMQSLQRHDPGNGLCSESRGFKEGASAPGALSGFQYEFRLHPLPGRCRPCIPRSCNIWSCEMPPQLLPSCSAVRRFGSDFSSTLFQKPHPMKICRKHDLSCCR